MFKFLALFILFSCSSSPTLDKKVSSPKEITMTAKKFRDLSQGHQHFIDFSLTNRETSWKKIKRIRLLEVSGEKKFSILTESQLTKWKSDLMKKRMGSKSKTRLEQLSFDNGLTKGMPLNLPGHFSVERWLVIYLPKESIESIVLELTYMNATKIIYEIDLH
jgi:hypothetical protein